MGEPAKRPVAHLQKMSHSIVFERPWKIAPRTVTMRKQTEDPTKTRTSEGEHEEELSAVNVAQTSHDQQT